MTDLNRTEARVQWASGPRQRLGDLLRTYASDPQSPWADEVQRLVSELDARQSELEAQNQELQAAQRQLKAYRGRYDQGTFGKTAITDITERKRAEEALRESEQFYRTLVETLPVAVVLADPNGRVSYISPAAKEMFGLEPGEGLGTLPLDWIAPEHHEVVRQRMRQVLVELRPQPVIEYKMLKRDRTPVWAQVASAPFLDREGHLKGVITVFANITERKQAEGELVAAKAAAEQANRAKDHFLAVLSHELRMPLTPVVMGLSMLQERAGLDLATLEALDMVRCNVELETRLIDDLLDVSRIARGKIELKRSLVDLCAVILRAVEVCRADIETRKLHFGVDLGPAAPYWVVADASRLQQVFWNLLKNAIKFTPHGGCVGIRCRPSENYVVVEVSDSGIGIEPEALSRIFNAFEQAERSITQQFGGLGLGLAISKALVEMHGGQIESRSEGRDKGATFRVRLPLIAPAGIPAPGGSPDVCEPAAVPPRAVRPLHILLVEDHGVTAKLMRMVLTSDGHAVETAGDLATALELAGQRPFDLLISDLGLPDGSGHDLMRELRRRGHTFPSIALSGYGQEEDIQHSREAGFAVHLTKPASREAVVAAVASVTG